jgi:hypothetical protein
VAAVAQRAGEPVDADRSAPDPVGMLPTTEQDSHLVAG